ncbi:hypothetical protein LZ30DRAFT_410261 [Colletotrichum cereale]|nr:hypothetical protein LZ30DRAFT_410261 [Colletotrichum cereale]
MVAVGMESKEGGGGEPLTEQGGQRSGLVDSATNERSNNLLSKRRHGIRVSPCFGSLVIVLVICWWQRWIHGKYVSFSRTRRTTYRMKGRSRVFRRIGPVHSSSLGSVPFRPVSGRYSRDKHHTTRGGGQTDETSCMPGNCLSVSNGCFSAGRAHGALWIRSKTLPLMTALST